MEDVATNPFLLASDMVKYTYFIHTHTFLSQPFSRGGKFKRILEIFLDSYKIQKHTSLSSNLEFPLEWTTDLGNNNLNFHD